MSEPNNYNRIALAACFGTFIEWYDFLTFATLAVHFAALFFPADDPVAGLLFSLAAFGIGMVVRPLGAFPNPEDLAFARPAPRRHLYHVLFDQPPIWDEGKAGDTVMVEIFEHWLEEA